MLVVVALADAVEEVDGVRLLLVVYASGGIDTADVDEAELVAEDDDEEEEYDGLEMPN